MARFPIIVNTQNQALRNENILALETRRKFICSKGSGLRSGVTELSDRLPLHQTKEKILQFGPADKEGGKARCRTLDPTAADSAPLRYYGLARQGYPIVRQLAPIFMLHCDRIPIMLICLQKLTCSNGQHDTVTTAHHIPATGVPQSGTLPNPGGSMTPPA